MKVKDELARRLVGNGRVKSMAQGRQVGETLIDLIEDLAVKGEDILFPGCFTVKPKLIKAKKGIALGKPYDLPERKTLKLSVSKTLKEKL